MKLPFLTTFILFVLMTNIAIHRNNEKIRKKEEDFWDKELRANSTRRKSLEHLDYVTIPMDKLPFGAVTGNDEIDFCEKSIRRLAEQRIVNLTGITNTDLKLEYGAPNITELTAYDQNYTTLVTNLQKWAKELYDASLYKEAVSVLEFAVSTKTDVTATYKLLCDLYKNKLSLTQTEADSKIEKLLPIAESLNSLSKSNIISILNSQLGDNSKNSLPPTKEDVSEIVG
ncbi:hypothetical protein [Butyrivibrio sp. INlla16]|uniref:hypothetical protein n=1 Tax=Butyrivibrio sp. INlla16 TaxID=1520807 RepID=UPI00088C016D|nr:hypothetical protein [Butyrivibrio sp. INlla16]SDB19575.1 hypothetical protein SAMN02910263_00941 [Butyrivibrio sp. INlla16]